jgi:polyhydroxyalkanoate synthesis regulator phasin
MEKLGAALPKVGSIAGSLNMDVEKLTAQLMVLADRGMEASTMGTSLRKIFIDLASKGISMQDAFDMINNATVPLTKATELFGNRAANAALILAQNTQETAKYENQLKNATGTSKRMADIMDSGTNGALRRLRSAAEGLAIDIGQMLIPILMKLVNGLQKAISFFKNLDSDVKTTIATLGLMAAAIGPILTVLGSLVTAFSMLLSPVGLAVGAMVAGAVLIVANWSKVKKPLVDTINYFIDLYNESMLFRGAINLIIASFKNMWAGAKFAFNLIFKLGKNMLDKLVDGFKSMGKIIKGVLTFDKEEFTQGLKEYGKTMVDTFLDSTDIVAEETKKFGDEVAKNFSDAIIDTISREKIEYISEEDVDNTVSKAKEMANKVLGQFKEMFGFDMGAGQKTEKSKETPLDQFKNSPFGQMLTMLKPVNTELEKTKSLMDILNDTFGLGKEVLEQYGESLGQQLSQGADSMKEYAKNVKNSIRDTIGAIIAQGVSVAISGALKSAAFLPPPLIPVVAGLAAGLARTAFNSLIPAFAKGGLVTGPTLGLVGEGAGITASNPEVIAPLNMLKNHINGSGTQQVEVYGRISGNDIFISNQRGGIGRLRSV